MAHFTDLQTRTITAVALLATIFAVAYFGEIPGTLILLSIMLLGCLYEWGKLHKVSPFGSIIYTAVGCGVAISIIMDVFGILYLGNAIILPVALVIHWRWNKAGLLAGLLYVPFSIVTAYHIISDYTLLQKWWMLIAIVWGLVVIVDIGAYFTGRIFGKHKLAPSISPGKTWEGFFGGVILSGIFLIIISMYIETEFPPITFFVAGCLLGALAQLGDLYQSKMKRLIGMKDSGRILPGHGGFFDRLDGLVAVLVCIGIALNIYWII